MKTPKQEFDDHTFRIVHVKFTEPETQKLNSLDSFSELYDDYLISLNKIDNYLKENGIDMTKWNDQKHSLKLFEDYETR